MVRKICEGFCIMTFHRLSSIEFKGLRILTHIVNQKWRFKSIALYPPKKLHLIQNLFTKPLNLIFTHKSSSDNSQNNDNNEVFHVCGFRFRITSEIVKWRIWSPFDWSTWTDSNVKIPDQFIRKIFVRRLTKIQHTNNNDRIGGQFAACGIRRVYCYSITFFFISLFSYIYVIRAMFCN